MTTLIFAALSLILYLLGMYAMSDWLPLIEEFAGRKLSAFTKAKILFSWPWLVIKDIVKDVLRMDP